MIFVDSFWCLWDFLLENMKLKDKLQIWGFESFISFFFWPNFRFFGTVLGSYSQGNFKFFCCRPTMVVNIFTQSPPQEKLPTVLLHHFRPIFSLFQYLPLYIANILWYWKVYRKKGKDCHELSLPLTQPVSRCSKLPLEKLELGIKCVQS